MINMKRVVLFMVLLSMFSLSLYLAGDIEDIGDIDGIDAEKSLGLKGVYLGQKPPGINPEIFAPGMVSTGENELNATFSPDGEEFFFTRVNAGRNTIMVMRRERDYWRGPQIASFSGKYGDVDPFVTLSGKKLYFSSKRPRHDSNEQKDSDLWYIEKDLHGHWGEPKWVKGLNTKGKNDYYTSIVNNGTLYFSIFEDDENGDLYRSLPENGEYGQAIRIDWPISTEYNEHDPFVAADESYIIFTSDRPGGYGAGDLYISFKNRQGKWDVPQNMGDKINSGSYDYCAMLSPDKKYLFFTSNRTGNGDIYWVDAGILEKYRTRKSE